MKIIKYILWTIILVLLGTLIYQNLDYFMTKASLELNLKVASWHWVIPELQNIVYLGICFIFGIIFMGLKTIAIKFRLNKEIKTKNALIESLKKQLNTTKTDLEVFLNDPYIKKDLNSEATAEEHIVEEPSAKKAIVEEPIAEEPIAEEKAQTENVTQKGDKSDTTD